MNIEKLKEVLSIQSESKKQFRMFAYIIRQLKALEIGYYVDKGNIYAIKGEATLYPCIVAHMDTVHDIGSDLHVLDFGGRLSGFNRHLMKPTGIGGDDKVGIFIALEALKTHTHLKAAFFRDEEIGCVGSYKADMTFFNDCSLVLQCDRQGHKDFITNASGTELCSEAFKADISNIGWKYGYEFHYGLMTDVMALKESGLKCSSANMSCGYYRPHTDDEYVKIDDVENCLTFVNEIINEMGIFEYPHTVPKKSNKWIPANNNWDDDFVPFNQRDNKWYDEREWSSTEKKWVLKKKKPIVAVTKPQTQEEIDAEIAKLKKQYYKRQKKIKKLELAKQRSKSAQKRLEKKTTPPAHVPKPFRGEMFPVPAKIDTLKPVIDTYSAATLFNPYDTGGSFHEDIYCADCMGEVATKNGLCQTCYNHYQTNYNYFPNKGDVAITNETPYDDKDFGALGAAANTHNEWNEAREAAIKDQALAARF